MFQRSIFPSSLGMLNFEAPVTAILDNNSKYLAFDMAQHPR